MKFKILLLFFIAPVYVYPQGVNNLWLMGGYSWAGPPFGNVNLDFTGGVLNVSYQSRKMNFGETNGVICDSNGNLLFSSNGIYISNAYNDTMLGGGLNPAYYTSSKDSSGLYIPQANLIIPFPDDSNKYYLFHQTSDDYGITYCSFYLYYSVIDMTGDNGKGEVTQKNIILQTDQFVDGRLTACKHANGRDWWLICHQYNSNKYFKYLITPSGIHGPYSQNIGAARDVLFGQNLFSPDGKLFAYYEPIVGDLDIFDFDRCTGEFTPKAHVDINDSANGGGAAFSPNSQVLYISSTKYVYQFDLTASDIPSTKTTVAIYDGYYSPNPPFATTFYLSHLAPDGKIYINCSNATLDIHVINSPNVLGMGCDVCQHCINLPSYNHFTMPNHPNYFLGAEAGSVCDSLTGVQSLSVESSKLGVYPNPSVTEDVTFTYTVSSEQGILSIYGIEGKEIVQYVLPQWSSVQRIRLPDLSSGVYLARLTQGNSTSSTKFVKE